MKHKLSANGDSSEATKMEPIEPSKLRPETESDPPLNIEWDTIFRVIIPQGIVVDVTFRPLPFDCWESPYKKTCRIVCDSCIIILL